MKIKYRYGKTLFVLLIATALLIVPGCNVNRDKETNNASINREDAQNKKHEKLDLAVYYVKYTSNDAYLVREVHELPYTDNAVLAALNELINGKPTTPGAATVIPKDTRVLGIDIKESTATVNFSREVLNANVGAEGEMLGIQSIVNTLTEFPEIEKVAFMVEGKVDERAREWWGHVGLYEQPFQRDLSKVYEPAIWVTYPVPNQVVGIPILVKGSARVYEGTVTARLIDANGKVLAEKYTTTQGAPARGNFEISFNIDPPRSDSGKLEVFWVSPQDGSEKDKVVIPLRWP